MYTVAVKQDFIAQHYQTGEDCNPENLLHYHHYGIEFLIKGDSLDEQGYLVNIEEINSQLNCVKSHFGGHVLNELEEFEGINPSIEHFARIIHRMMYDRITKNGFCESTVRVWEDAGAWASFSMEH